MKRLALLAVAVAVCAWSESPRAWAPFNVTIVVTPNDLAQCGSLVASPACAAAHRDRKWFFYDDVNDTINNTIGSFVICQYGPCPYYDGSGENPPLGIGSVQISTVLNRRPNLATYQFGGIKLAAITTLRYSTYNPSAGNKTDPSRSGYLQFNVDFTGTSTAFQRRLTFVPRNNSPVVQDHWKEWDTINGGLGSGGLGLWTYSGPTWPLPCTAPGTTPKPWSVILTCYPNARILPGDSFLGIRVGEPYPDGYTENIDAFKFGTSAGTITFNFEPAPCACGHGDGGMKGGHGGDAHFHFHKNGCDSDDGTGEDDNVQYSDPSSGVDFKSTSITLAVPGIDGDGRTVTLTGIGLNNGLPVLFTMTAMDNGDTAPGVFSIVLSDGYSLTGTLTSGAITVR